MDKILKKLFPKGLAWDFSADSEKVLDAKAENLSGVKEFLKRLSLIFDAFETDFLDDVSREFGLSSSGFTEAVQRERLNGAIKIRDDIAPPKGLETFLSNYGFSFNVYQNELPTNPENFIAGIPLMVCGELDAQCGEDNAECGYSFGGEVIINGKVNGKYEVFAPQTGWEFIFFIGGTITKDGTTGEILSVEPVDVPSERKEDLRNAILKYKPKQTWAILFANYV